MLNAEVLVVVPALVLDLLVGDPVSRWHPVAVFGRSVERVLGWAPSAPRAQLWSGIALTLGAVAVVALGSSDLLSLTSRVLPLAGVILGALAFKVSFAYRQLRAEAIRIATDLEAGHLMEARTNLSALVSRETGVLTPAQAASAAIESLAENLCDSVAAPFFFYALLGVPGALGYRALNTLDAMIGYHGKYEYLGKTAAMLDDWANAAPARFTALLLMAAAWLAHADARNAVGSAWRDHARTKSPNAGWPMATMAGALRVELTKVGQYRLGAPGAEPSAANIRQAVRIADRGAALAAIALIGIAFL
jgi:adenosylcobinamide-phosphate synthase